MERTEEEDLPAENAETESNEEFSFPPAERKVVTQPLDLSVQTLVEQWGTQVLVLPEIQREYVWDNGKASRLIESLLLNIPIPILYFAETNDAKYEVIDGHQRVHSIARYLNNQFPLSGLAVLREYKGLRFHQLPAREQRFLSMRTLRVIIISIDSHPSMKFEIFERLNTGAITLNAQELRNSIYRGPFNVLLHELARDPALRQLLGTKAPRKRMVDEELLLRFFALRANLDIYRTPLKRFLNNYMLETRDADTKKLRVLRALHVETVQKASSIFGAGAFRVTDSQGVPVEKTVNRALFDAQMLASSWVAGDVARPASVRVKREVGKLFGDETFLDSIQRATGDRARTLKRLRETCNALLNAGLKLKIPFDLSK